MSLSSDGTVSDTGDTRTGGRRRMTGPPVRRGVAVALGAALISGGSATLLLPAAATAQVGGGVSASADRAPQAATWSDARWSDTGHGALDGDATARGTVEIDWQARPGALAGSDFELELPDELVALVSPEAGQRPVTLLDDHGDIGATGTWNTERTELEVTLAEPGLVEYSDGTTDPLGGTLAFDVTWAQPEALSPGPVEMDLAGEDLVAVYAPAAAAETSASAAAPAAPATGDARRYQAEAEAGEATGDTGDTDGTADGGTGDQVSKPKPTKPKSKPTKPTKPSGTDKSSDDDSREPVSRDAGGRKKVSGVPSGPTGSDQDLPDVGLVSAQAADPERLSDLRLAAGAFALVLGGGVVGEALVRLARPVRDEL